MYGLLLEGIRDFIVQQFGENAWSAIVRKAEMDQERYATHTIYVETLIPRAMEAAAKECKMTTEELLFENGKHFISFLCKHGYEGMLKVLGRDLRDFLNGLDNLHEYLRFTYPKLKPPSFFCVNESATGITLQYRTRRPGFNDYVRGLITALSKTFYNIDMEVDLVYTEERENVHNSIFRLHFNNKSFHVEVDNLPVPSDVFFEVFPFNIVFNRGMRVLRAGSGIHSAIPDVQGRNVCDIFLLTRPLIEFCWDGVMLHTNNIFELISLMSSSKKPQAIASSSHEDQQEKTSATRRMTTSRSDIGLKLRGQMKYMPDWDAIVFLGTPIMRDVESMWKVGLFLNDLSMHDSSRDLVLAGEQQSAELKLALEQENEKSKRLEESCRRLDEEMKRSDELLYQMIPRAVADRLRTGEGSVATCETFEATTILFSDVVGFTTICSRMKPLEVVNMLNNMYSIFDQLTEQLKVYKVETIGDAYMLASGCPIRTKYHAAFVAEMALSMIDGIQQIKDQTVSPPQSLRIRVGVHSGIVVAGVVGVKMPRYCLFGETVNIASRMESSGAPQQVQISEATKAELDKIGIYKIRERGKMDLEGHARMTTYWLEGRASIQSDPKAAMFMAKFDKERDRIGDSNLSHQQQSATEDWTSLSNSRVSSVRTLGSRRSSSLLTNTHGAPEARRGSHPRNQ